MAGRFTTAVDRRLLAWRMPNHLPSSLTQSLIAGSPRDETLPDSGQKLVAHFAIGLQALLAAAFDGARVRRRPIFDIDGIGPRDFERAVMCLRRQRDDQIEIEPFPFLDLLEGHRLVPRNIESDFVHRGDRERIELAFAHAGRADIDRAAQDLAEQSGRHGRAHRIQPAGEQYRQWTVGRAALRWRHRAIKAQSRGSIALPGFEGAGSLWKESLRKTGIHFSGSCASPSSARP